VPTDCPSSPWTPKSSRFKAPFNEINNQHYVATYKDIAIVTPNSVVLEALVGQLFPVILIARLVAIEIEYHRSRQP
jgi:hypothetical protein